MFDDFTNFMSEIWTHQPIIIVVLVGLALLFPLLVIDTYRHRKKAKKTRDRNKLH